MEGVLLSAISRFGRESLTMEGWRKRITPSLLLLQRLRPFQALHGEEGKVDPLFNEGSQEIFSASGSEGDEESDPSGELQPLFPGENLEEGVGTKEEEEGCFGDSTPVLFQEILGVGGGRRVLVPVKPEEGDPLYRLLHHLHPVGVGEGDGLVGVGRARRAQRPLG